MTWLVALMGALFAAGCSDDSGTGPETKQPGRVAYVIRSAHPELYVQNLDGSGRTRISFTGAEDQIPGNSPLIPRVADENIIAMGPLEWSPDGKKLAVVVTLAYDQSEIVVVNADGSGARVASPNTQIIMSDVDWSPDGKRLVYTMSTRAHATGIEVFMTDLETNRVQALTTNLDVTIAGVSVRFDATGSNVLVSHTVGFEGAPYFNYVGQIESINVASGARQTVAGNISGEVNSISRSGGWALVVRATGRNAQNEFERTLYRRDLATGAETAFSAEKSLWYAELSGDEKVVVYAAGSGETPSFSAFSVNGGSATAVQTGSLRPWVVDYLPAAR